MSETTLSFAPNTTSNTANARFSTRLLAWIVADPTRLLISVWCVYFGLFYLGPLHYSDQPDNGTLLLIFVALAAFAFGTTLVWSASSSATPNRLEVTRERLERVARATAIMGLLGAACIILDKFVLQQVDLSAGLASLRLDRQRLRANPDWSLAVLHFFFFGLPLFSFANVALLLLFLRGELLSPRTRLLGALSFLAPVAFAVAYGSRGSIIQAVLLVFGAVFVRIARGEPALPQVRGIKWLIVAIVLGSQLYSIVVFAARRVVIGRTDYSAAMAVFESEWGLTASPRIEQAAVQSGDVDAGLAIDLVNSVNYFTHGFAMLERMRNSGIPMGPWLGQAQVNWVPLILSKFAPSLSFETEKSRALEFAHVDGVFTTALGPMLGDFGTLGAIVECIVLGALCRWIWIRALLYKQEASALFLCFAVSAMLYSPISPPFGFGNALNTFATSQSLHFPRRI